MVSNIFYRGGEDFQFDQYFSDGLVQPPTRNVRSSKSVDIQIVFRSCSVESLIFSYRRHGIS